jgi:hypothetical protein
MAVCLIALTNLASAAQSGAIGGNISAELIAFTLPGKGK